MSNAKETERTLAGSLQAMSQHKWTVWGETVHCGEGRVSRKLGSLRVEGSPAAGWNVLDASDKERATGLSLGAAKATAEAMEQEIKDWHVKEGARLKALADAARANPKANVVRAKPPVIGVDAVSPIKQEEHKRVTYTTAPTIAKPAEKKPEPKKPEPAKHGKHK